MFSGLFLYFGWTGDHWPQTADGDGEPGDWWPWEEVDQEGRGHQRAERTGQSHRWPEVRFLLRNQLTSQMWRFKNFFFSFFLNQRKLGASEGTINQEIQRYQQLESVAVNDIRRDVRKKLRRSSMRVSALFFSISSTWKRMRSNYAFIDSTTLISLSNKNCQ